MLVSPPPQSFAASAASSFFSWPSLCIPNYKERRVLLPILVQYYFLGASTPHCSGNRLDSLRSTCGSSYSSLTRHCVCHAVVGKECGEILDRVGGNTQ